MHQLHYLFSVSSVPLWWIAFKYFDCQPRVVNNL